ncbi:FAD-binding oxidoreductase [Oricola cellulosilytica]|uniref:FAD-binding oxidoreductase n=1 Tax=Oricola cellulosilytica TaxID=1429082 RepID=A0A4R0PB25_9HYPH|nr:FAD-binding oxidoreductase [Oricola cellulosilytica]TCD13430.1 FAD-binding oxidoreductase [Oricola cellulosilytica]
MNREALLQRLIAICGSANVLVDDADTAPYLKERRGRWTGKTMAVVRPGTTAEVSQILKLASETGTPVVPQGGNTGLVGGQIPDSSGRAIVLSTSRLNRIRDLDTAGDTITVEAGVVLQTIRETVDRHDRLFPLSLAAQGTSQIGGNLSSNAGGTGALTYGVARDLCLGLEVVLPTGEILDDLNRLKKDNTGYNLRNLFIGAEGTLGVITAAVLKLFPKPAGVATAVAGTSSPEKAHELFRRARQAAGPTLSAFELMPRIGVEFTTLHIAGARDPLAHPHPWYVLLEISSGRSEADARTLLETVLGDGLQTGTVEDAAIADSGQQRNDFWRLREGMSESQIPEGGSIKHDISVPVDRIPAFMADAEKAVLAITPEARIVAFGHLGDGNLHYNISQPAGAGKQTFLSLADRITPAIHDLARRFGGSISAEHGVGQMKRDELAATKSPVALELMRRIKRALDPVGIMNPGKVILSD